MARRKHITADERVGLKFSAIEREPSADKQTAEPYKWPTS
jgi:hypothetical protein